MALPSPVLLVAINKSSHSHTLLAIASSHALVKDVDWDLDVAMHRAMEPIWERLDRLFDIDSIVQ